jgi:5-methylcytosine-specific restriction protein A
MDKLKVAPNSSHGNAFYMHPTRAVYIYHYLFSGLLTMNYIEANKMAANLIVAKRTEQSFYDSRAWRKLRAWFIRQNPVCVECKGQGIATVVDVVDHITPIKEGGARLDASNLQSLCNMHHNQKSARERGRAGQKSTVLTF